MAHRVLCTRDSVVFLGYLLGTLSIMIGCGTAPPGSVSGISNNAPVATRLNGVILGYSWDSSSQGLRSIQGIPGGASLGPIEFRSLGYAQGIVSSRSGYALLTAKLGDIYLSLIPGGVPKLLVTALSTRQKLVISPGGSAAAIFADDKPQIILLTHLPSSPMAQEISPSVQGTVANVAVSDNGSLLLAITQSSGAVSLASVSAGVVSKIGTVGRIADIRFIGPTDGAIIGDAGQNTVWWVQNVSSDPRLLKIAGSTDGVRNPLGVAGSFDGHWAIVANQGGILLRIDLMRQQPIQTSKCFCTPTMLVALSGNATFQITAQGTGPTWLYEGDTPTPRAVFVPAIGEGK